MPIKLSENDWILITYGIAFTVLTSILIVARKLYKEEIELRQNFYETEEDVEDMISSSAPTSVTQGDADATQENSATNQQRPRQNTPTVTQVTNDTFAGIDLNNNPFRNQSFVPSANSTTGAGSATTTTTTPSASTLPLAAAAAAAATPPTSNARILAPANPIGFAGDRALTNRVYDEQQPTTTLTAGVEQNQKLEDFL